MGNIEEKEEDKKEEEDKEAHEKPVPGIFD